MNLVEDLVCRCNGKAYVSLTSLNAHRKTKGHLAWETENELRESLCRSKRFENEISQLKMKHEKEITEKNAIIRYLESRLSADGISDTSW